MRKLRAGGFAAVISMVLVSEAAMAQEAGPAVPADEADAAETTVGNQDIIVTARRREESLSKVPLSVTALGGDSLIEQGVRSELDLQTAVPGFQARQVGSASVLSFSIRGQSIDGYSSSPPAVLPYLNDFQIAPSAPFTYFDLEGVEVVKGPQGTLFGRNTTGGAVLYRSKMPGDKVEGAVSFRYGSFDSRQVQAAVTAPIVPGLLSVRLAGNYSDGGGFQKNLGYYSVTSSVLNPANGLQIPTSVAFVPENRTLGDVRNLSGRATVKFTPGDSITNTTVVQYAADDGTSLHGPAFSQGSPLDGFPAFQAAYDFMNVTDGPFQGLGAVSQMIAWQRTTNRATYTELSNEFRTRSILGTNTTTIDLTDDIQLKNIAGWFYAKKNAVIDLDGTGFLVYGNNEFNDPVFFNLGPPTRGAQQIEDWIFSNETQLQGEVFDGRMEFTLGVFYSNARHLERVMLHAYTNPLNPYDLKQRDRSMAGFAQITYKVTDDLSLTGGFRYSKDTIRARQGEYSGFGPAVGPLLFPNAYPFFSQEQEVSFKDPSWTISADYQVTPELLLYVTQRGSWRAGGFNFSVQPVNQDGTGLDADGNPIFDLGGGPLFGNLFKPERARDVEVGAKYSGYIGDMPFTFTLSAYNQWITDIQRAAFLINGGAPALVTLNVPKAEMTGQEASITARPARWLSIGGQVSHINARYTDGETTALGQTRTYGPYGNVPDWSGSAFFEITHDMAGGGNISLRGDVYAQSKMLFADFNPVNGGDKTIPGYALVNGRLSWNDISGSGLTLAAYGKNIFDKRWYGGGLAAETAFGTNTVVPGRPREFGVELRFEY